MYDSPGNGRVSRRGECDGQNRFCYRGCDISRVSALAGTCERGEWSNCRWRSGRTYRRRAARRRSSSTARSASGLLFAGAGLRRRARVPISSRTLLGWIWLAIPPSPDLQLNRPSTHKKKARTQAPASLNSARTCCGHLNRPVSTQREATPNFNSCARSSTSDAGPFER